MVADDPPAAAAEEDELEDLVEELPPAVAGQLAAVKVIETPPVPQICFAKVRAAVRVC